MLRRVRNGSSWEDIAVVLDPNDVETLKELYKSFKYTRSTSSETQAVSDARGVVAEKTNALGKELDRISNLARFPRTCTLWQE